MTELCCQDCGRSYSKGPDLVVSDVDWAKIAPRPNGGGVLCPNCMNDRFEAIGAQGIVARFTSGPFARHDEDVQRALRTAISHIEHMAKWIGDQKAGYSFESLGEDMPGIRAALVPLDVSQP